MFIVKVEKGGGLESAIKKLKRKWDKNKIAKELRSRKEFIKTTDKKRSERSRAIYIEKKYKSEY
jgi:small subunit ribosomal protein S21